MQSTLTTPDEWGSSPCHGGSRTARLFAGGDARPTSIGGIVVMQQTTCSKDLVRPMLFDRFFVADSPELLAARNALRSAVTELQFQDMASQLIWHTTKVLQGCAFRLASEAMGHEEGEEAARSLKWPLIDPTL